MVTRRGPIEEIEVSAHGRWEEQVPGWLLWQGDPIVLFGVPFHMMAIETTGEDLQRAAYSEHDEDLEKIQAGCGSSAGYEEIDIFGRPHVVFLVPYDR